MTNKAYEYEQWARAWDRLPVEERLPALGAALDYGLHNCAQLRKVFQVANSGEVASAAATFSEVARIMIPRAGVYVDRITVEE